MVSRRAVDGALSAAASELQCALRRFKPYPAYKDSGIEWLGEIPAHWEMKRLKRLSGLKAGTAITADNIEPEGDYPVFGGNGLRGYTSSYTHNGEFPLIGRQGALCGCVVLASGKFWASEHAIVVTPRNGIDADWLANLLQTMSLNAYSQSAAQPGLGVEKIAAILAPTPEIDEQRAIVAFLDRETARIDALVAKKEQLIALLQEQRTAIITRAVTRGLDPNVPMRDSHVEWLGEIPAHWEMIPLKRVASVRYGLGEPPRQLADGLPFIRATNVTKGRIVARDMQFVDPKDVPWDRDPVLRAGDVIVVRSGAYTGDSAIIPAEYDGAIAGYDMVVRPRCSSTARFLAWALLSRYVLKAQIELESLRAAQPHLNAEELGAVFVLLPPKREQPSIITFLDWETARIDALVAKIREAIDRSMELRTALISAAVTGKIDIREGAA